MHLANRLKEMDESQDEEIYEERFKNDIENQLKMRIIDGGTPQPKEKSRRKPQNLNEEEFLLEDYEDFYEISNKNDRIK